MMSKKNLGCILVICTIMDTYVYRKQMYPYSVLDNIILIFVRHHMITYIKVKHVWKFQEPWMKIITYYDTDFIMRNICIKITQMWLRLYKGLICGATLLNFSRVCCTIHKLSSLAEQCAYFIIKWKQMYPKGWINH